MIIMRKRFLIYIVLFLMLAAGLFWYNIRSRYDISVMEYIRYSMPYNSAELTYLANREILYGIDINDAPFAFVSPETGQYTGILVDYLNQLSVTLEGDFSPVEYDSYNLAVQLKNGAVDCSVLTRHRINTQVFLFTQPLYTERSKILVSGDSPYNSLEDVRDLRLAIISNSTAHHAANDYFAAESGVSIVLVDDFSESIGLLEKGEVDAVLGDETKISYLLNQGLKANRFKFLEGAVTEEEVGIAMNRDQLTLYSILNKAILEMKKGQQFAHIHSKWFGSFVPEIDGASGSDRMVSFLFVLLLVLFISQMWTATVANKVDQRTRELNESREELNGIIDSLHDGLIVTDGAGRIQFSNTSIQTLLGVSFDGLNGRLPEEVPELAPYLEHSGSNEAFLKDGRYYLIARRKMDTAVGNDLIFIEDYTERNRYERLNRQEAKMIAVGELSAGLAHEIRNPLGIIKSYLYLLKRKVSGTTEKQAIETMDESVRRINSLIENLLGFSRLSTESASDIRIRETVDSILELERKNLEKNGILLQTEYQENAPEVLRINEDVLRLILVNLINNSVDALRDTESSDKEIRLRVETAPDGVTLTFSDNGTGIPEEVLEEIFNPFYTTKENGTGLGLYILDSELRQLGGDINVESCVGKGTTFTVRIPAEAGGRP